VAVPDVEVHVLVQLDRPRPLLQTLPQFPLLLRQHLQRQRELPLVVESQSRRECVLPTVLALLRGRGRSVAGADVGDAADA
jgi:hypothetical protein